VYYEELRQATHDRLQLRRGEADARRLARQARGSQYRRRRKLTVAGALRLRSGQPA
jgi:hypothetical protein